MDPDQPGTPTPRRPSRTWERNGGAIGFLGGAGFVAVSGLLLGYPLDAIAGAAICPAFGGAIVGGILGSLIGRLAGKDEV